MRDKRATADRSAVSDGSKCERKALSHSIIYGSTADKSAVCNGSKSINRNFRRLKILRR